MKRFGKYRQQTYKLFEEEITSTTTYQVNHQAIYCSRPNPSSQCQDPDIHPTNILDYDARMGIKESVGTSTFPL